MFIEFPFEEGGSVLVEIDSSEVNLGLVPASRPGEIAVRASQSLESALENLKPTASIIIQKLKSLDERPTEVEVEFGIKLTATAGMVIANGGIDAHYKVTLKWTKE